MEKTFKLTVYKVIDYEEWHEVKAQKNEGFGTVSIKVAGETSLGLKAGDEIEVVIRSV